jgi:hypothetical protein
LSPVFAFLARKKTSPLTDNGKGLYGFLAAYFWQTWLPTVQEVLQAD